MAETQFEVDPNAIDEAIRSVQAERDTIAESLVAIATELSGLAEHWKAPSYGSYDDVRRWYDTESQALLALLDDILDRLRTTHRNYVNAETANVGNLSSTTDGAGG